MKLLLLPLVVAAVVAGNLPGTPLKRTASERAYQKCYSCHAVEPGKNDLAGPSLHGIVGRRVASVPGFDYSPALRRFAGNNPRWTTTLLDRYAADPERLVPGTSMAFHGMPDKQERRALMKYLSSLGGTGRKSDAN